MQPTNSQPSGVTSSILPVLLFLNLAGEPSAVLAKDGWTSAPSKCSGVRRRQHSKSSPFNRVSGNISESTSGGWPEPGCEKGRSRIMLPHLHVNDMGWTPRRLIIPN